MVYFLTATKRRSRGVSWSIIAPPFITAEGTGTWIDPAEFFGLERVSEVGVYLDATLTELRSRDANQALKSAEKALARWLQAEPHTFHARATKRKAKSAASG